MSLTIYFSGSISGGRADAEQYRRIVAALERRGFHVIAGAVTAEIGHGGEPLDSRFIFERDLAWIDQCDVVVAEVSMPSTGVGYEIATARYRRGIPVICLYRPVYTARCTAMVSGDMGVELIEYTDAGFEAMVEQLANKLAAVLVSSPCPP